MLSGGAARSRTSQGTFRKVAFKESNRSQPQGAVESLADRLGRKGVKEQLHIERDDEAAVVQPRILIHGGLANSSILAFSPVKRMSGQTAKPSCMLNTT